MIWVYHDGAAPLIAAMCRTVGLTKTINEMLHWDPSQCRLSPGSRIEAIIMNALTNRRPLYKLEQFFKPIFRTLAHKTLTLPETSIPRHLRAVPLSHEPVRFLPLRCFSGLGLRCYPLGGTGMRNA